MADFKIDPLTGDLDLTNGLSIVRGNELYRQKLKLGLGLNLGEWFANVNAGLPYLNTKDPSLPESTRYFLGDRDPNQREYITRSLDEYIENYSFVASVESTTDFSPSTRKFEYKYRVSLVDGSFFSDTLTRNI